MNQYEKYITILINYLTALHPKNFFYILHKDRTLAIKFFYRSERVDILRNRLLAKADSFSDTKEYITFVLHEIKKPFSGCDYIIFQIGENRNQFVQFDIAGKRIELDFPFFPANDHLRYIQKTRKLIESLGFNFTEGSLVPLQYSYVEYSSADSDSFNTLRADFDNDIDLTAEFVYRVFNEVFDKDVSELRIELGTGESKLSRNIKLGKAILHELFKRPASK